MPRLAVLLGPLLGLATLAQEQEEPGVSFAVLALLVIVGLGLVVAEVFFVSFGILSVLATVALVSAVFLAFQRGQFSGFMFLTVAAVGVPVAVSFGLKWLPNTPVGRLLMLSAPDRETVSRAAEAPGLHGFLHKTGVTVSPLRPAGFARIDGRRVDVVTRGEMLDRDCPVRVIEVEGNRVVVAEHRGSDPEADTEAGISDRPAQERVVPEGAGPVATGNEQTGIEETEPQEG